MTEWITAKQIPAIAEAIPKIITAIKPRDQEITVSCSWHIDRSVTNHQIVEKTLLFVWSQKETTKETKIDIQKGSFSLGFKGSAELCWAFAKWITGDLNQKILTQKIPIEACIIVAAHPDIAKPVLSLPQARYEQPLPRLAVAHHTQPNAVAASALNSKHYTHELSSKQSYYKTRPFLRSPDGCWPSGTKVILILETEGYSKVQAQDGTIAFVNSFDLHRIK